MGFYGNPEKEKRRDSWELIKSLQGLDNLLWILGGDFNEVMYDNGKQGGKPKSQRELDEFKATLSLCHLVDLGYRGDRFTWKRRDRKGDIIKERLDRFVANMSFLNKVHSVEVNHLSYHHSDHRPILATMNMQSPERKKIQKA